MRVDGGADEVQAHPQRPVKGVSGLGPGAATVTPGAEAWDVSFAVAHGAMPRNSAEWLRLPQQWEDQGVSAETTDLPGMTPTQGWQRNCKHFEHRAPGINRFS